MRPISLTLKGFRGIRDGLGREELTLDFDALAGGAQLIAIAGKNGRGKTTVMDNMTPYPLMPSRAGADGVGLFSYYDHVFLPESVKDLVWEHGGKRYRSQIVIRLHGKKKTEAYLHVSGAAGWMPVTLLDGTVSDGKMDTYLRCVEAILGSAQTFFTSMYAAQGRRQLSAYRNAEIKTLLADLLGLDEIRALGAKAADTVKLLKAGLVAIRQERCGLESDAGQLASEITQLGDTRQRIDAAQERKSSCQRAADMAKEVLARIMASKDVAMHAEVRRSQFHAERRAIIGEGKTALASLDRQDQREAERLGLLDRRLAQRVAERQRKRSELSCQRDRYNTIISAGGRIEHAARRLPVVEQIGYAREARLHGLRRDVDALIKLSSNEKLLREKITGVERAAGHAVLKTQELARRLGLTAGVPCAGSDLQGQCKLLGDARDAQSLMPSADLELRRLERERRLLNDRLADIRQQVVGLADAPARLARAEDKLRRTRSLVSVQAVLAARRGELQQAREALAAIDAQLSEMPLGEEGETSDEQDERCAISKARQQIALERVAQAKRYRQALDRMDEALAELPAPFDEGQVVQAQRAVAQAQQAIADAETGFMTAVCDQQRMEELTRRHQDIAQKLTQLDAHSAHIEQALGVWTLFARCMSKDGLIALSIDDAGPTLSGLANELLLACYGPRFTVSIKTQVETGKGESREGFDILVHDADSGASKSVTTMSGGERVWINECLTRAIALYLAQHRGRRYETVFSDEADGALDPDRKRIFIAMKREVLRIGGYGREFFVSQTSELTAMADAIIDLEPYVGTGQPNQMPPRDIIPAA
ncbi:DNA repair protein [Herbaspirillum sp. ST 5-3]|uniref:DNA repair protein n=1 Tax=Oxalobacteraceae TaxID=75682 RepID=UPI001B3BFB63|nr:DNA repair protein [Herbaspirillum sp. ST 5-3]